MTLALFDASDIVLGPEPERDAWCSPTELRDALMRFTGGKPVDLDPCTNDRSIIPAITRWTRTDAPTAAPIRPWRKPDGSCATVWCNWPWSKPGPWADAAVDAIRTGEARWVVGCGIADPSVQWFQRVWEAVAVCFPDHRVQFDPPPGADASSNSHPIALPLWTSRSGPWRADLIDQFERAYQPLGKVVRL
jgi:DNA N-6-adenine-methyltransferase Dam